VSVAERERGHQPGLLELLFDANITAMRRNPKPVSSTAVPQSAGTRPLLQSPVATRPGQGANTLRGPHGRRQAGCDFPGCDRKGQPLRTIGGGRWVDPKGYFWIKCPVPGHPNAKRSGGWIAEHVWVMSQMIGRPLRPGETVHHRNLIRSDNRPSNLELWTSHQPRGARVSDMLAWCRWFLSEYERVLEGYWGASAHRWEGVPGDDLRGLMGGGGCSIPRPT